jgi:hypothetical protein
VAGVLWWCSRRQVERGEGEEGEGEGEGAGDGDGGGHRA